MSYQGETLHLVSDSSVAGGPDRSPAQGRDAFVCPQPTCGVFAQQKWQTVVLNPWLGGNYQSVDRWTASVCEACDELALWLHDRLIFPSENLGPAPASDMPSDVLAIYEEARAVSSVSKKSAAGLLRLALQLLVDELEPGAGDINSKIGKLVQRGLHSDVQRAMDILRVVGNESVHPGTIDLDADDALLPALFGLVNLIVEQVITRPKHVGGLFGLLPASKLEQIAKRDGE